MEYCNGQKTKFNIKCALWSLAKMLFLKNIKVLFDMSQLSLIETKKFFLLHNYAFMSR